MDLFFWIREIADFLWGPQMLVFILGSGIYFSFRLKGIQFSQFFNASKATIRSRTPSGEGNITPYQAFSSALSGMVGNGNIAGVATAITIGGPGAVFWMWISAIIGMATMYSESLLGFEYRQRDEDGTYLGGPMVYIEKGLRWKWLAVAFAAAMAIKTLVATTSVQSNSMSIVLKSQLDIPQILSCIVIALLTWMVIVGGIKSIAKTAQVLVPIMTLFYLAGGFLIILLNFEKLGQVLSLILTSAFTTTSAAGGFAGATVLMALRYGAARGAYSNEAGTGSVAIMHATAQSDNPVRQSLISMMSVFIDTLILCSLTAFVILLSGLWSADLNSTALTSASFAQSIPAGHWIVIGASLLFGYSTLIAWCFYGEQCAAYILGDKIKRWYRWAFCLAILVGATSEAENIWSMGDLLNGITVIINLIGIIGLSGIVVAITGKYSNTRLINDE